MSEDLTKKPPKGDDNIALILQNIDSLLQSLERKVDERLHDTRPIWQKVVADIAVLQDGQNELKDEVRQIKVSIREMSYQIGGIGDTLVRFQGKNKELEERVRHLEQRQQKPTNSQT